MSVGRERGGIGVNAVWKTVARQRGLDQGLLNFVRRLHRSKFSLGARRLKGSGINSLAGDDKVKRIAEEEGDGAGHALHAHRRLAYELGGYMK